MSKELSLSPEAREDLIRRTWYSHDAKWYAAVAMEFGIEAANRLNRAAVKPVGAIEAYRLATALGSARPTTVAEFIGFMQAGRNVYVPDALIDMKLRQIDEHSYEESVGNCYVEANITKAGMANAYECAVLDRIEGWHEAMGLPIETPEPVTCLKARGLPCQRVVRLKEQASQAHG
ncbi:MAG: hypothetical protein HS107_03295 [Thermoflexaceae bacterium]|nr:hypothetical protein [Thermoflexaceae bacterium]